MIQLTGAAKRFGPKTLFENFDWLVTPNERAGIVGANGTGKSTLLKILAGMDGLDAGSITTMKGATIGYLPQEGLSLSGRTVFAECMTVFADVLALEQEQETLAHRMSELDPPAPSTRKWPTVSTRPKANFLSAVRHPWPWPGSEAKPLRICRNRNWRRCWV
ncbi:MAG: ATP-binding cassette domain-containing protein [Bryobacteraceae bacterium]|jgi:ATP-binding cassette subfamily F protein 3